MLAFWETLSLAEKIFGLCGICGSLFFVFRFVSMILGSFGDSGVDADGDGIADALEGHGVLDFTDADGDGIADALEGHTAFGFSDADGDGIPDFMDSDNQIPDDVPLKRYFLSIQNISAFVMMFGWVGLAMMHSSGFGIIPAIIAGLVAGFFIVWLLVKLTKSMKKLECSGNTRITSAIGQEGTVYLRIPAEGTGQIEVALDGRLRICDALSRDGIEIVTGSKVKVSTIDENGVLVVVKADN